MSSLVPLAALVKKDLQIFFTDRRAVVLTLAIPIAIASFFGSLFQGSGDQEAARVPVAMVDQDGSAVKKRLITATATRARSPPSSDPENSDPKNDAMAMGIARVSTTARRSVKKICRSFLTSAVSGASGMSPLLLG